MKNEDNFQNFILLGSAFAGIVTILLSNIFINGIDHLELKILNECIYIFGFTWIWVRSIYYIEKNLSFTTDLYRFAIAWFIPISVFILLGYFQYTLPLDLIGYLGILEFLYFIFLISKNKNIKNLFKGLFFGFLITGFFSLNVMSGNYSWITQTYSAGGAYADAYRDASYLQSWSNYGIHSFGVHGLMKGDYHPLFSIFLSPFLGKLHPFEVFNYFSLIITPSLFLYAWIKIFKCIIPNSINKNILITIIVFLTIIPLSYYYCNQRSFMTSSFISISAISLLLGIFRSGLSNNFLPILALFAILPFITLARAFDGLFWILCLSSLIFFFNYRLKIFIIIMSLLNFGFLFWFYIGADRSETGIIGKGLIDLIVEDWFIKHSSLNPTFLIGIIIVSLFGIIQQIYKIDKDSKKMNTYFFYFSLSFGTMLLMMRTTSATDAFYQLAPFCVVLFFLLANHFFSSLNYLLKYKFSNNTILFAVVLLSMNNLVYIMIKENSFQTQERDFFKSYVLKNNVFECNKTILDPFCNIRRMYFGFEIDWLKILSSPSSMITEDINENFIKTTSDRNFGIYINPDHNYWKQYQKREQSSSVLIMASSGYPLIFGVPEWLDMKSMSINKAKRNGGILMNIDLISKLQLCNILYDIKLTDLIIYDKDATKGRLISC